MPVRINATLYEANDEKMDIVVSSEDDGVLQDLTGSVIEVFIKTDADTPDNDPTTVKLSTETSGVTITDAVNGEARISFPNDLLPTTLWWRVDVLLNGLRKTACYGSLYVTNV